MRLFKRNGRHRPALGRRTLAEIVAAQMLTEAQVHAIVDERAIWGRPSQVTA
ncbi:hypothetical protein JGU71_28390 [Antrihabitans sp. YC3-6]|uniref:Uncharacterized protein n=1 Tax=Antrihabitans stalagmiti TaxID=2799499 RepID=A0A934NWR4_9NOCA|nr:hypothetical protein [Antrihabitans stalagmiti]MBJ8342816.1 hypothetical protein [Antrihabitans stalagmiti]